MRTILFVDDEKQILRSLRRLFPENEYNVELAECGKDALEILKTTAVDLVVSDVRMPGMSGFELLREVKSNYPGIIRIALSGYTETKEIYKALEENLAKMYIFKPWDNRDMKNIINNLFALEDQLRDKRILTIINNLGSLPTLPEIYYRIRDLISIDEDVDKIAHVIEEDLSTASKVLRIANSAYYGAKTGSVSQAILYIGLSNMRNIILTSSLIQYKGSLSKELKDIWKTSTVTNRYVNIFYAHFMGKKIPKLFASAGLFCNIGKVIFISCYSESYSDVLKAYDRGEGSLTDLELKYMGVTNQELGGYLLNWWEMPLSLIEVAFYNHMPLDDHVLNKELLCITHIASIMAMRRNEQVAYSDSDFLEGCCTQLGVKLHEVIDYFATINLDDLETVED